MPYRIKSTLPPAAPVGKAKLDPNWRVAAAPAHQTRLGCPFACRWRRLRRAHLPAPARRKDPLQEAGGDRSKMRALTLHDIVQCVALALASRQGCAQALTRRCAAAGRCCARQMKRRMARRPKSRWCARRVRCLLALSLTTSSVCPAQHRQLVMDLLACPWVFPFYSRVLANCPSARKVRVATCAVHAWL